MKIVQINISHFCFVLHNLKIFDEIPSTHDSQGFVQLFGYTVGG